MYYSVYLKVDVPWYMYKYKKENNRSSSENQISLVHNLDKVGNKYYTKDNKIVPAG